MAIQWFPGHMHKAGKEIKTTLSQVDVVIEILDARIPFSSQNPLLARLRADKPCIKVLNKSDLADPEITLIWQNFLEQQKGVKTLALCKDQGDKVRHLRDLCKKVIPQDRSAGKLIHALIMGIPNVGKSTLINALANRMIAKTGNEPAITKRQQRIALGDDLVLLDTPGMLWPNVENSHSGYRLAITGAIKDTAISHDDIAAYALDYLVQAYPECLKLRYKLLNFPESSLELLKLIGSKRGCLQTGGHVDIDKAAKLILTELRGGKLGRITLESPDMMQVELNEVELIRQMKLAKQNEIKS